MKSLKYIVILIVFTIDFQNLAKNSIHTTEEIKALKKNGSYRLFTSAFILLSLGIYHQKKIDSCFKNFPLISIFATGFTIKCFLDLTAQIKKINADLFLLEIISKIYLHIKSALVIEPNKEKCFDLIKKYSGFSIEEIKEKTDEIIAYKITCINCNPVSDINYEYIHIDEISKDSINIEEIILELKNEPEIYNDLLQVKKNNPINQESFFKKIGKEINEEMNLLIKEKYEKNIIVF